MMVACDQMAPTAGKLICNADHWPVHSCARRRTNTSGMLSDNHQHSTRLSALLSNTPNAAGRTASLSFPSYLTRPAL